MNNYVRNIGCLLILLALLSGCDVSKANETATATAASTSATPTPTTASIVIPSGFALVSGGSFTMGTDSSSYTSSGPSHLVTVSSFLISKYELTFDEYDAYVTATGATSPSSTDDFGTDNGRGQHPVINVSRLDAIKYCNWRSEKEGLTKVYTLGSDTSVLASDSTANWTASGYRLPTDAEWEFAAKGGSASKGYTYSGGNTLNTVAVNGGDANTGNRQVVGSKVANEVGAYDMSGNAQELVWDLGSSSANTYKATMTAEAIASPTTVATVNPHGILSGTANRYIIRGAHANSMQDICYTPTIRKLKSSTGMACVVGFRIAKNYQ